MEEIRLKNKTIMVVGAHPDDNDFTAAGAAAKAARNGCRVIYVVATKGNRGSDDRSMTPEKLWRIRRKEQIEAGKILGVSGFEFLEYNDGELVPDIKLKEDIVMLIRKHKPDIVFTMDPSAFYYKERGFINHTDHRAIAEATMDAVYPLARDFLSFPRHAKKGLSPFAVKELCFASSVNPHNANAFVDISNTISIKIKALACHKSQIGDIAVLEKRIREWSAETGKKCGCGHAEAFVRIRLADM